MRFRHTWVSLPVFLGALAVNPARALAFNLGYHHDITRDVLKKAEFSDDAIAVVLSGNELNDIFQTDESFLLIDDDVKDEIYLLAQDLHFDQAYNPQIIDKNFRLLVRNARDTALSTHQLALNDVSESHAELLLAIGISLHTIQDFYAHSNWAELDLPTFPGVPADATYWDLMAGLTEGARPPVLDQAMAQYVALGLPRTENGLFTHWSSDRVPVADAPVGTTVESPAPHHVDLCKDWATSIHFDDAYRAAYKASLEWVKFFQHIIVDVAHDEPYWQSVTQTPQIGSDDLADAHTFSGPQGTAQFLSMYGGAWKRENDRWSGSEIVLQDLPNVHGINVLNTDEPFLYPQWRAAAQKIADSLFEPREFAELLNSVKIEKIDGSQPHNVTRGDAGNLRFSGLPATNTDQIDIDVAWLGTQAVPDYAPNWLKLVAPFDSDNDDGDGWFNINDEDPGGPSDYYTIWRAGPDNGPHTDYYESINRGSSRSINNWQTLLPFWEQPSMPIGVQFWDSDDVDWFDGIINAIPWVDLSDDQVDINPSDSSDALSFTLGRAPFGITGMPNGVKIDTAPYGFLIHASGHDDDLLGDNTASLTLQASPVARNTKVRLTILEVRDLSYFPHWKFGCYGYFGCNFETNEPTCNVDGFPQVVQCAAGGPQLDCQNTPSDPTTLQTCDQVPLAQGGNAVTAFFTGGGISVNSVINYYNLKPSDGFRVAYDGGLNPPFGQPFAFQVAPGWEQRWEGYLDWDTIPISFQIQDSEQTGFAIPPSGRFDLQYHMATKTITGQAAGTQIAGVDGEDIVYATGNSDNQRGVRFRISVDPGVWGAQPPSEQVSEYFSADRQSPDDNQIRPRLRIRNKGNTAVPLSEFKIRYWYSSEGRQPEQAWLDYVDPAIGMANVTTKFVKLRPRDGSDGYIQVGFKPGAGNLAANSVTPEIQLRFNKSDWSAYHETGDYSYNPVPTTYVESPKVTLYRNNVLIYGTEPEPIPQSQIVQAADIFIKDEGIGESNVVKPRFYLVNTGNVTIRGFHLRYFFTAENGKTPVLEKYYLPNVTATLENLGNGYWDVDYHWEGMSFGPTMYVPDPNGFVSGIHYSDWSAFDKSNDLSNPGTGTFKKATNVQLTFD
jgi:hypothetical protein